MGGCMGSGSKRPSALISNQLDQIQREKQLKDSRLIKLLLLGTGNSGKSTLYKQIVNQFGSGFTKQDRESMLPVIRRNVLLIIQTLIEKHEFLKNSDPSLQIPDFPDETLAKYAAELKSADPSQILDDRVGTMLESLWNSEAIKKTFDSRFSRFQMPDSSKYFMENAKRYCTNDCIPNDQDYFRARAPTLGITQTTFHLQDNPILLVDVGGQRNERRKWIHCFEEVTLVLFVVGISEYDQVLYEDGKVNRLSESLQVFEETLNNAALCNIDVVLFLNKIDLFTEKLPHVPFVHEQFHGDPHHFGDVFQFIQEEFIKRNKNEKRKVYCHEACATDTSRVQQLLQSIRETIIRSSLKESRLFEG